MRFGYLALVSRDLETLRKAVVTFIVSLPLDIALDARPCPGARILKLAALG